MDAEFAQLEQVINTLYTGTTNEEKQKAVEALSGFQTNLEYVQHCKILLEKSQSQYGLLFASSSLCELVTTHWSSFAQDLGATIDLRNYLLSYLWNRYGDLSSFVINSVVKLLCRVTKLGWSLEERHKELPNLVDKFLESTIEHKILGFKILNNLIEQVNARFPSHSIVVHRNIANNFRESALLSIFEKTVEAIKNITQNNVPGQSQLFDQNIECMLGCLSFDFYGSGLWTTDNDEIGIVQIPTSWRSRIVDGSVLSLLFGFYAHLSAPHSARVMECIALLTSIRGTLFETQSQRTKYLSTLLQGVCTVLQNNIGLLHVDNHHQLCRVLTRVKNTNQLPHLNQVPEFENWLNLVCEFTCKTFQSWQWSPNSIFYLLSLWSKLAAAARNHKSTQSTMIFNCSSKVLIAFLQTRMDSVLYLLQHPDDDDMLDEDEHLQEQLETLPNIIRVNYSELSSHFFNFFDPLAAEFEGLVSNSSSDRNQLSVVEGKLSWLVFMIGAIIGGRLLICSPTESTKADGDFTSRILQLQSIHDRRLSQNGVTTPHSIHLEKALLSFLFQIRQVYIGEQSGISSGILKGLADNLQINGNEMLMELVVRKIIVNLNFWYRSRDIIKRTLDIFENLITGYLSVKRLSSLELVDKMILNHTAQHFPFLTVQENGYNRTIFYRCLGRLLFLDRNLKKFDTFIAPFSQSFEFLLSQPSIDALKQDQCKSLFIGLLRDLRGLFFACQNRANYERVWDWIYPKYIEIIGKAAGLFYDCPTVMSPLLKLTLQLSINRASRLDFGCTSATGILLFREISKIVVEYGSLIGKVSPPQTDRYNQKLKGVYLTLKIMGEALSGNYVNFSVFELYGDPALTNALNVCIALALDIPDEDLKSYPKLNQAYFSFFQNLSENHIKYILQLDSTSFMKIVRAIQDSINTNAAAFVESCSFVESLAKFYINNRTKENDNIRALNNHLQAYPDLFTHCLGILFQVLLFIPTANHYSIANTLFSLIILDPARFHSMVEEVINTQAIERRQPLFEAFSDLMRDIDCTIVSNSGKERFTRNMTAFKNSLKTILAL